MKLEVIKLTNPTNDEVLAKRHTQQFPTMPTKVIHSFDSFNYSEEEKSKRTVDALYAVGFEDCKEGDLLFLQGIWQRVIKIGRNLEEGKLIIWVTPEMGMITMFLFEKKVSFFNQTQIQQVLAANAANGLSIY